MGSLFGSGKKSEPTKAVAVASPPRAPSPAVQAAIDDAAKTKADDERRVRAEREALARGLRGQRSLLSGAGEAGYELPSRLGGG